MSIKPFAVSIVCMLTTAACAQVRTCLSEGWKFIRTDMASPWEVMRPVKAGKPESVPLWTDVTLPHCYNAEDGVAPDVNYYQGGAWYRTTLKVKNPYPDGHTLLEFEGAGQKTDVYLATRHAGSHVGGYDQWRVDITEWGDGEWPLAIRCDNSRDVEMIGRRRRYGKNQGHQSFNASAERFERFEWLSPSSSGNHCAERQDRLSR